MLVRIPVYFWSRWRCSARETDLSCIAVILRILALVLFPSFWPLFWPDILHHLLRLLSCRIERSVSVCYVEVLWAISNRLKDTRVCSSKRSRWLLFRTTHFNAEFLLILFTCPSSWCIFLSSSKFLLQIWRRAHIVSECAQVLCMMLVWADRIDLFWTRHRWRSCFHEGESFETTSTFSISSIWCFATLLGD